MVRGFIQDAEAPGKAAVTVGRLHRGRYNPPLDLVVAGAASASAGTLTAILHRRSVSPHTLRKLAIALTKHPIVPGLEELIDLDGLEVGGGTSLTA